MPALNTLMVRAYYGQGMHTIMKDVNIIVFCFCNNRRIECSSDCNIQGDIDQSFARREMSPIPRTSNPQHVVGYSYDLVPYVYIMHQRAFPVTR